MKTIVFIILAIVIVGGCFFIIISLFLNFDICFHQWEDGVKTWKYQQYLERDDALTPPVALYECTKCGKIRIVGGDDSHIFEPIDPNQ